MLKPPGKKYTVDKPTTFSSHQLYDVIFHQETQEDGDTELGDASWPVGSHILLMAEILHHLRRMNPCR